MQPAKDYYAILGVERTASQAEIKAAFKKLALQYHPDRNKSEDANTHMSELLEAYQVLNDPEARKDYDALRKYHNGTSTVAGGAKSTGNSASAARTGKTEITPRARRDRQRHYAFPSYRIDEPLTFNLGNMAYTLPPKDALALIERGMLRGNAPRRLADKQFYCHRCHHTWREQAEMPRICPKCHASDWQEYLLLRCTHCKAIFESEQIRYEIGTYTYSKPRGTNDDRCPPYELFPLCPYCAQAQWCPAENQRVASLRKRMETQRLVWTSVIIVLVVIIGILALGIGR